MASLTETERRQLREAASARATYPSRQPQPVARYLSFLKVADNSEMRPDSDLDFLVVVPESPDTRYTRSVEARRLLAFRLAARPQTA